MTKIFTRGPKIGICNICGDKTQLTEDHTPPKGSISLTQVEMNHIVELLSTKPSDSRGRISQNGVKYRTLCACCNNEALGLNYDLEFNRFSKAVGSYVESNLHLPRVMTVRAKPQKIIRSLVGLLMAQKVNGYRKGPHTEDLKDWFLDEFSGMPNYMKVYYWVYPYNTQVLIREAVMVKGSQTEIAGFWLMKFFPLAFFIIWDSPSGSNFRNLRNFDVFRDLPPDDTAEILVDLKGLP